MTGLRLALGAILLSLSAAAGAAPPRVAPAWQVDWGDQFCSLIRLPDPAIPYIIAVRALPGSDYSDVFLAPRGSAQPPEIDSLAFAPSARSFDLARMDREMSAPGATVYGRLPLDFWDTMAGAGALQLRRGARAVGQVPLVDAAAAVRALRQCVSDAMREWGFDEAAWRALSRHPRPLNALGIDDQDYPREAVRRNVQGRVVVRVDVNAEGRVTACAPVATSHMPAIDAAACHAALVRGRFRPALDAAGAPAPGQYVTAITFLIGP